MSATIAPHSDPTPDFTWRDPRVVVLIAYCFAMAVIGLLIPEDVFRKSQWARDFTDVMASIVPQINRIAALDMEPDADRFYFSLLWAGAPCVLAWMTWCVVAEGPSAFRDIQDAPLSATVFAVAMFLLLLVWSQCLWFVGPSTQLAEDMFGSPLKRSFYGQFVLVLGPIFSLVGLVLWIAGWIAVGRGELWPATRLRGAGMKSAALTGIHKPWPWRMKTGSQRSVCAQMLSLDPKPSLVEASLWLDEWLVGRVPPEQHAEALAWLSRSQGQSPLSESTMARSDGCNSDSIPAEICAASGLRSTE
jgi:hypothetical protein